jgi:hypothetical protein
MPLKLGARTHPAAQSRAEETADEVQSNVRRGRCKLDGLLPQLLAPLKPSVVCGSFFYYTSVLKGLPLGPPRQGVNQERAGRLRRRRARRGARQGGRSARSRLRRAQGAREPRRLARPLRTPSHLHWACCLTCPACLLVGACWAESSDPSRACMYECCIHCCGPDPIPRCASPQDAADAAKGAAHKVERGVAQAGR